MRQHVRVLLALTVAATWATPAAADPIRLSGGASGSANSPGFRPPADTFYWFYAPGSRSWSPICPCTGAAVSTSLPVEAGGSGGAGGSGAAGAARLMYSDDGAGGPGGGHGRHASSFVLRRRASHAFAGSVVAWDNGLHQGWFKNQFEGLPPAHGPWAAETPGGNAPMPEPATLLLLGAGLAGAGCRALRKGARTRKVA
jgi:hypothetical protein